MALEEHESAGILADEDIDAGLCRTRQHLVAGLNEVALGDLVETRMRDLEGSGRGPRQRIPGHGFAVENAVTFGRQRPPFDAVEMQHRGMRSEARPDR